MRLRVADDQVRRTGTHAPARDGVARSGGDVGRVGEAQVIVAGEREQRATADGNTRTLRGIDDAPRARKAGFAAMREVALELRDRMVVAGETLHD